ncbi:neuronal acetylcholine receptor subunit alpha-7-like [Actinia tenebrosa]|uniref:Neuronal acetylcholine receptor subunit alpha-7-like n=1 Tax=Actinia tenebrosa TaxID=6105 RepID=A0A6P8J1M7_ACTTE|nr:neuronal acetylcholine receptor subunit alpha-7-like [Actinia tenebrosa]XP_031573811.1 neuronal acetylcholine receptor subunit alpha-7-like [Actinia tenebrosa]
MNLKQIVSVLVSVLLLMSNNVVIARTNITGTNFDNDEAKLLKDVLGEYNKKLRPVISKHDKVEVKLGFTLNQIIDVIEKYEILKLSLNIRQIWDNPLLAWNASEYGNIFQVNLEPSELWKPDIYLYNNADSGADGSLYGFKAKITVDSAGRNVWLAPTLLTTSCKINVRYFPFDQQACTLKFGSWTYDAASVDVVSQSKSVNLLGYQANGEWDMIGFPCKRNEKRYVCCPNPFTDVTCTLHIRRRTMYYWINLVVPCLLITVLSLLSFIVSTESGERISLVITNLLALTVFMLIVADILPPTSEVVPLISTFLTCSIVEVGIALVATCIALQCYHTNPEINEMPFWMRYYVNQRLGKLVGITSLKKKLPETNSDDEGAIPSVNAIDKLRNLVFGNRSEHRFNTESNVSLSRKPSMTSCKMCQNAGAKSTKSLAGSSRPASTFASPSTVFGDAESVDTIDDQMDHSVDRSTRQPKRHACASRSKYLGMLGAIIHRQDHIVEGIQQLAEDQDDQDKAVDDRFEWILAAHIIDRFFLYCFIAVLFASILMIFALVPKHPNIDEIQE